jgi:hypothetical protein
MGDVLNSFADVDAFDETTAGRDVVRRPFPPVSATLTTTPSPSRSPCGLPLLAGGTLRADGVLSPTHAVGTHVGHWDASQDRR